MLFEVASVDDGQHLEMKLILISEWTVHSQVASWEMQALEWTMCGVWSSSEAALAAGRAYSSSDDQQGETVPVHKEKKSVCKQMRKTAYFTVGSLL